MKNGIVINRYGTKFYYKDDMFHNEDGPAIIYTNGILEYWINDKLHREDGPAVIYPDGEVEYWINDEFKDVYRPGFGCFNPKSREEALERLNSKDRPYCREMYLSDIDKMWPIEEN